MKNLYLNLFYTLVFTALIYPAFGQSWQADCDPWLSDPFHISQENLEPVMIIPFDSSVVDITGNYEVVMEKPAYTWDIEGKPDSAAFFNGFNNQAYIAVDPFVDYGALDFNSERNYISFSFNKTFDFNDGDIEVLYSKGDIKYDGDARQIYLEKTSDTAFRIVVAFQDGFEELSMEGLSFNTWYSFIVHHTEQVLALATEGNVVDYVEGNFVQDSAMPGIYLGGVLDSGIVTKRYAGVMDRFCIVREAHQCACDDVYDPVCGIDGNTYSNLCEAMCAGVVVVSSGECEEEDEPDPEPEGEGPFGTYPWITTVIDTTDCEGVSLTAFSNGDQNFFFVDNNGMGILYDQNGAIYCQDFEDFSCLGFYNFTNQIDSLSWMCGDEQMGGGGTGGGGDFDPFTTFPWLSTLVNVDDCDGITVEVYENETTTYVNFINDNTGFHMFYTDMGEFYCIGNSTFDCPTAYGFDMPAHVWNCGDGVVVDPCDCSTEVDPVCGDDGISYANACEAICAGVTNYTAGACDDGMTDILLSDFPWLTTIFNPDDCSDEYVAVYVVGETTYVYVEANGIEALYLGNGAFWCQSGGGFSCLEFYGLTTPQYEWECNGFSPDPDIEDRSLEDQKLSIYPNPSQGEVSLELSNELDRTYKLEIYNMSGQLLIKQNLSNKMTTVQMDQYEAGMYLVKTYSEDGRWNQIERLIIVK